MHDQNLTAFFNPKKSWVTSKAKKDNKCINLYTFFIVNVFTNFHREFGFQLVFCIGFR